MAVITFFAALGDHGFAVEFFDEATLVITDHTDTTATMTDVNGARVDFTGTGLQVDADGAIAGGIITGITLTTSTGDVITTVSKMHKPALALWAAFVEGGLFGVEFSLIKGDDRIFGSSVGDYMIGLGGDDVLFGRGGKDAFLGGTGSDRMTGDAGADLFAFADSDKNGHDVITDFHATGPKRSHDHIATTTEAYNGMRAEQVIAGVLIHWAWGADLLLEGVKLKNLDISDFNVG